MGPRPGLDTEARGKKILCLCRGSNLDHPVFQPVARHYTDCVTRLTVTCKRLRNTVVMGVRRSLLRLISLAVCNVARVTDSTTPIFNSWQISQPSLGLSVPLLHFCYLAGKQLLPSSLFKPIRRRLHSPDLLWSYVSCTIMACKQNGPRGTVC
jgi:hypothetical protein